ncbi:MAG TPA: hypothetical protein IAA56_02670 [Candidatus Galloscillospira excrementavium]|nr:hypothetical protein [Candidatus Galloscillospira excrementavium]
MRRVTCKDCRYVYDYDKDDFCPRCGSYNPPGDTGSTRLEQELLSRFGDARRNQTRAREQQAERAAEGRRHLRRRGTYASGGPAGRVQQTRRLAAILVVLVIVAVVVIAGLLTALDLYLTAERAPENSPADGATAATEQRVAQGERFAYYDMECTADGMWRLDVPAGGGTASYLLVDLWVEGGGEYLPERQFADPVLRLDGAEITAAADRSTSSRLSDWGVYVIQPRDTMWEDPLYGQLVFPLAAGGPEGADTAELVLEELDGDGACAVRSVVTLEVPAG